MNEQDLVYTEQTGTIGRIYLNRQSKKNALTMAMWQAVSKAVTRLDNDSSVRVIQLLSAVPGVFAAGADIGELKTFAENPEAREENRLAIRNAQRTLARASKPTIAVIDGPCVGGGCGLAVHCDFRLASPRSKFGITPARLGLVYPMSDLRELQLLVGTQGVRRLLYTAELIDGQAALDMGLVDELLYTPDLENRAQVLAHHMADLSQYSLQHIKKMHRQVLDGVRDDDDNSVAVFLEAHTHDDAAEGLTAFLEKRPVKFPWKGNI